MAILDAVKGQAPSNATIGDTIRTAGGNFTIVPPGVAGSSYNPASGHWSINAEKADSYVGNIVSAKSMTDENWRRMNEAAEVANMHSSTSAQKSMDFSSAEAQKQRDWQKSMSDTAYQRQVADLKSAGLNPVLGFLGSGGATTPSGASASGDSYSGQKSDVDTTMNATMASIFNSILGNETQLDIAKIQAETMLQTAGISSAAQMYNANKMYDSAMLTRSPGNIFLNTLLGENTGKVVDAGRSIIDGIEDFLKFPSKVREAGGIDWKGTWEANFGKDKKKKK